MPQNPTELKEDILPNDYPIYADYWYVLDGYPIISDYHNITVKEFKHYTGAKEIRRCDIIGRKLL